MGFRFQRRISFGPGFRVNLSKSGVSTSVGGRGGWFTLGPRGTRLSLSLLASAVFVCVIAPVRDVSAQENEPRNLSFEEPTPVGGSPPGWWFIQHAGAPSFEFAIDDRISKDGQRSLRIKRTGTEPFGLILQTVRGGQFRGKRVRLTAFLRLDNVEPFGRGALRDMSGATLLLRSQGNGAFALDDMRDRPLRGTKAWSKAGVEIDVPPTADIVEFGATLSGTGTLWATAFKLEVVELSATARSDANMGIEARAVARELPPGPTALAPSLKPRYPDKAAFLADVKAVRSSIAVELDGEVIWTGFGPAASYRTSDDGSVTR
jgi:hypothetical protein